MGRVFDFSSLTLISPSIFPSMDDDLQQPLYKPSLDRDSLPAPLVTADQCRNLQDMDDSQLIGPPDEPCVAPPPPQATQLAHPAQLAPAVKLEAEVVLGESAPAKRRRGRPPKGQGKVASAQSRVKKTEDEEEDVCFICFDGGSLVLCDRRSCPKAYHPACIKRDEAFFRSKAKWNCGWHICSSCQKASHYMCYTCTYSSCKGCIKDADYVCVRGDKGLCGICIRTIMLIENNVPENQETVKVDFDDKTSWEYLFKVYWVYLKEKLSLTLDELTQAKNPWKEPDHVPSKRVRSRELFGGNIDRYSSSDNFYVNLEGDNSKRRRMRKQSTHLNKDQLSVEKLGPNKEMPQLENPKWATKELLEFVAHMKNGDTSVLSQFDVQTLLLEYIKRNNLRDPQKKCQIICDSRLVLLFGKERVGHIEMLKLLEFHFLIKENTQRNNLIEGAVLDPCSGQVEADWISDNQPTMTSDKKRKKRKKADEGGPNSNLDEYAAINVHNINLIFLRRTLMENLIDDTDKFHDKVVGSIVRIRISNSDQKQDMYRLVQVVGTSKVAEPYKIGSKTTDVMLEILNLDKKEVISIDEISNQKFTEDECKCLRQYIKCGLIKRLSVGEIQEKAMKLQAVRVNDWLEAETLRLGHLRDRASEKGLRKELRECVEKLQLLNSPEERQRRLLAIPEVHADPNMDPSHDSEDDRELDWKKSGNHMRLRSFGFGRKEGDSVSPLNTYPSNVEKDVGNLSWHPGSEAVGLKSSSTSKNQVDSTGSTAVGKNDLAVVRSELSCGVASEISGPVPYTGPEQSANEMETDKLWNYQDPTGKIQGPFCLVQMRKWSIIGHFPPDLKIWRLNGKQDDSILLIDALDGRYDAEQPLLSNSCLLPEEVRVTAVDGDDNKNGELSGGFNTTLDNSKKEDSWDAKQNDENALSNGKEESERSKELGSPSCSSAPSLDVINSDEEKAASVLLGWDSMKGNNSRSVQPQVSCSLPSSIISSEDLSNQVRKDPISEGLNSSQNNGNCNSHETVDVGGDSGHSPEKQSNSQSNSGQSAAEDRRLHVEEWDSKVVTTSSVKPNEMASDHAATPTSMSELTHSSPAHPLPNASSWQLLVNGPEELFPLVDESVSDLLAEVEAMESLCGLSSGTSNINCGGELVQDSKNDCFDPAEGFSPTRDLGKNDALSSTGDLQISLQCTVKDEPREISESDVRPIELFSKSAEVEAKPSELFPASSIGTSAMAAAAAAAYSTWSGGPETVQTTLTIKPSDVSVSQWQASAGIPPPPASTTIGSLGMVAPDSTWRGGPETTAAAASWVSSEQGNPNMGWIGGLSLGNSNMGWTGTGTSTATATGTGTGTMLQHLNVNWGNSHTGNQGIWGNQPRHGGERYPSPRDRYLQSSGDFSYGNGNGSSSSSRGRPSWSRQVGSGNGGGGSGGGGGSFRSPPKGQRVCKFHESGYCKKGASCSYLHP